MGKRAVNDCIDRVREPIPMGLRRQILRRDRHTCRYCGVKEARGAPLQIDHVYPVDKGGSNAPENLAAACARCNGQKSNRLGIWPKPLGYFETQRRTSPPGWVMVMATAILIGVIPLDGWALVAQALGVAGAPAWAAGAARVGLGILAATMIFVTGFVMATIQAGAPRARRRRLAIFRLRK